MVIKRGELWWANLPVPEGSEPGYKRPVLIIQSNAFNQSRIGTTIAVAITSNTNLAEAPGNVLLKAKNTKLKKDSVANVSQIITIDKCFLKLKIGKLSDELFDKVIMGVRLVLDCGTIA